MDCSDYSTNAPPTGPLLYQQYEEQSSLCDVVIKTGLWEKRFHWCVLVASPFFDNIHRNNYLEKQTGIIELNKWPASVVETALLFLYGRTPLVTEANSDTLMDIAEFLLIPELKVTCIGYLVGTKVTLDNCMRLYELSSVYGFTLEQCDNFIKGKLPEVLEQERMLNTTTESLKLLLADTTLRYVTVQSWFRFLVRWVNKAPERQHTFVEFLNMLDFSECDKDFIDNTVTKEPLVLDVKDEVMERLASVQDDHNDTVLIFNTDFCDKESIMCLNMRTMLWYRIGLSMDVNSEELSPFWFKKISSVKNSNSPCIYKVRMGYQSLSVLTYDLSNAQYTVTTATAGSNATGAEDEEEEEDADWGDDDVYDSVEFASYSVVNDTLTAASKTPIRTAEGVEEVYSLQEMQFMSFDYSDRVKCRSTLYTAKLDEPVTDMHAVLTFKDHAITELFRSNAGTVAMLSFNKEKLFIFNESAGELECIQLKHDHGIEIGHHSCRLAAVKDDFVLYYSDFVVCIMKLSGASLEKKYHVKLLMLEKKDDSYEHRYFFDGDRWFRLSLKRYPADEVLIEYVSHNELTTTENTALLCWESIPIPSEANIGCRSCNDVYSVSLPKGTTRCHLNCPHCLMARDGRELMRPPSIFGAFADDLFADTDDDDNYLYSPDGSSFDDHYNYDSEEEDDFIF